MGVILSRENQVRTTYDNGIVGIRSFTAEDASSLYEAARESITQLCAWMVWCHPGYSLEDSATFVADAPKRWSLGERYSFAIFSTANKQFLGSAGLSDINQAHGFANIGYWVRSTWANRGVASTATRLLACFAFEQLRLHRLEFVIPVGNHASERVAAKIGAKREGVLRKRLMLQGKPHDALMMSLLSEDLKADAEAARKGVGRAAVYS
jgi:RimJ/RimL family protein N-acetyltransferase